MQHRDEGGGGRGGGGRGEGGDGSGGVDLQSPLASICDTHNIPLIDLFLDRFLEDGIRAAVEDEGNGRGGGKGEEVQVDFW